MKTLYGIPVKTDSRIRRGSLIGYRDGVVSWYGPIDKFPPRRQIDEVHINQDDLKEIVLEGGGVPKYEEESMSARLKLADEIAAADGVKLIKDGVDRLLPTAEVEMITTSMHAVVAKPDAEVTSAAVAEHAGRLVACKKWSQFARFYGSDEKAWDAIQAVAGSAMTQKEPG